MGRAAESVGHGHSPGGPTVPVPGTGRRWSCGLDATDRSGLAVRIMALSDELLARGGSTQPAFHGGASPATASSRETPMGMTAMTGMVTPLAT
jgi:hypothetical protein